MAEENIKNEVSEDTSDLPEEKEQETSESAGAVESSESTESVQATKAKGTSTVSSSEITSLQEKLNEKTSQLVRLAADFDNFKKRQRRDSQMQVQNFAEKLMKSLLPVLDSMDRAKENINDGEDIEHLREGFLHIYNLFHRALAESGVTAIDAVGEQFDPRYHEALMHHPEEGAAPGSVTVELQKGWIMGERVLRAARVGVAPDDPHPSEESASEDDSDVIEGEARIIEDGAFAKDCNCDESDCTCDGAAPSECTDENDESCSQSEEMEDVASHTDEDDDDSSHGDGETTDESSDSDDESAGEDISDDSDNDIADEDSAQSPDGHETSSKRND